MSWELKPENLDPNKSLEEILEEAIKHDNHAKLKAVLIKEPELIRLIPIPKMFRYINYSSIGELVRDFIKKHVDLSQKLSFDDLKYIISSDLWTLDDINISTDITLYEIFICFLHFGNPEADKIFKEMVASATVDLTIPLIYYIRLSWFSRVKLLVEAGATLNGFKAKMGMYEEIDDDKQFKEMLNYLFQKLNTDDLVDFFKPVFEGNRLSFQQGAVLTHLMHKYGYGDEVESLLE